MHGLDRSVCGVVWAVPAGSYAFVPAVVLIDSCCVPLNWTTVSLPRRRPLTFADVEKVMSLWIL